MKISLNKIKQYVQIPEEVSDEELIELIGSRLVEVEEVIDWTPRYQGVYVAKVVNCEPIPDTHLSVCWIDAGVHNARFNQLENGLVQVVCGAPNVHAGMLAVWITPGAIVPETYGNENFKLSVRKLRGFESNGMLAGADELGFDNEHKAIAEIDPKDAKPGDALSDVFGLNDKILDVENKSLTHRPDCFGLIGFAREVAGILGQKFIEPSPFDVVADAELAETGNKPKENTKSKGLFSKLKRSKSVAPSGLTVEIQDGELCPEYTCAVFELPNNQSSKYLTKEAVFLAKSGMRAIDPLVDLTNIIMLETGQPLHAFDYDKLVIVGGTEQPKIIVRAAEPGEKLQLLDGKTIECQTSDILITSNDVPIALAGAMGGKNTEIDPSTQRVVLESATFSLYHLRKTQMAHGIFSEAITRFTKGQPAAMTLSVLEEALKRLAIEPSAEIVEVAQKPVRKRITASVRDINQLLGTDYDLETILKTLQNVGFEITKITSAGTQSHSRVMEVQNRENGAADSDSAKNASLEVLAPVWRTDIHVKQDIIEEVGRLLGYDNIVLTLPKREFSEPVIDKMIELKREVRSSLSDKLAMHELLTYSFVSSDLLRKVGQNPSESYEIVNSISPELQCFRQQIAPSLIDKIRENVKSGHRDFSLYEVNQVTHKALGLTQENVPLMHTDLGIVSLSDFYHLKLAILTLLRQELKVDLGYAQMTLKSASAERFPYFEPAHSAEILVGDEVIGAFGELKASVLRAFKLTAPVSACEIELDSLLKCERKMPTSLELSKFPPVERDLTFKVAADSPFWRSLNLLEQTLANQDVIYQVTPLSVYQAKPEDTTKNLSFHIRFSNPTKTLDSQDISVIMKRIAAEAATIGAEIV